MSDDLLNKSAFAALLRVHPSRVSQYIAEGKIYGDAIFGTGRRAQIRVSVAQGQLALNLDPAQRLTTNAKARLDNQPPAAAASPAQASVVDRVQREKLIKLELDNERAREERSLRTGLYTRTDDVRREMGRVSAEMQTIFDGALTEFANEIAAAFKLPPRDILYALRKTYRRVRERGALEHEEHAAAQPMTVDDATVVASPESQNVEAAP